MASAGIVIRMSHAEYEQISPIPYPEGCMLNVDDEGTEVCVSLKYRTPMTHEWTDMQRAHVHRVLTEWKVSIGSLLGCHF